MAASASGSRPTRTGRAERSGAEMVPASIHASVPALVSRPASGQSETESAKAVSKTKTYADKCEEWGIKSYILMYSTNKISCRR